jgi:hypothetical protein
VSERGTHLADTAERQITELLALLSTADEAVLRQPCQGREKLGDGTIGALARHIADSYLRIAAFLDGHDETPHADQTRHQVDRGPQTVGLPELVERIATGRRALRRLGELADDQLDSVPAAGTARFCDGERTLEQVLAAMLKHQAHQIAALRMAIAS